MERARWIAIAKLLTKVGVDEIIVVDRTGAIYQGRENLNEENDSRRLTNPEKKSGKLINVTPGADI